MEEQHCRRRLNFNLQCEFQSQSHSNTTLCSHQHSTYIHQADGKLNDGANECANGEKVQEEEEEDDGDDVSTHIMEDDDHQNNSTDESV